MIVVLDTNALHGDVYAERSWAQTLFEAAENRDDLEIRVPSVVVEELVRQFPERFDGLDKAFRENRHAASAYGLDLPKLPDRDQEVACYRSRLESNLDGPNRGIVPPPSESGIIAEWIAQRRQPIPGDGGGAVDAQVWLTAVEFAADDEVVLITNNSTDFADPDDRTKLHPVLCGDLSDRRIAITTVTLMSRILDFNQRHIAPAKEATATAEALLANTSDRAQLTREIEDAVEWFPLDLEDSEWALGAEVDSANIAAFDTDALRLVRADRGPKGTYLTLEALGEVTIELWLWKGEAYTLPEGSPIEIDDYDFNESMATGRASMPARMLAEALISEVGTAVSIEEIHPVSSDEVLWLLKDWVEQNREDALALVADGFDVPGVQQTTATRPRGIAKFAFSDGSLYVRAEFDVDYANPIDEEDHEMSAENITEHSVDLKIAGPDLANHKAESVDTAPAFFPN